MTKEALFALMKALNIAPARYTVLRRHKPVKINTATTKKEATQ